MSVTRPRREVSPFIGRVLVPWAPAVLRDPAVPSGAAENGGIFSSACLGLAKTHFLCEESFLLPCWITPVLRGAAQYRRTVGILWEPAGIL